MEKNTELYDALPEETKKKYQLWKKCEKDAREKYSMTKQQKKLLKKMF